MHWNAYGRFRSKMQDVFEEEEEEEEEKKKKKKKKEEKKKKKRVKKREIRNWNRDQRERLVLWVWFSI